MSSENLEDDKVMQETLTELRSGIDDMENLVDTALETFDYDSLNVEDKVKYDLFLAYVLNIVYWAYLRTQGVDPNNTDAKYELERVRDYMERARMAHDRKTIRPKVNREVAARFVKHGIRRTERNDGNDEPHPKKKKVA